MEILKKLLRDYNNVKNDKDDYIQKYNNKCDIEQRLKKENKRMKINYDNINEKYNENLSNEREQSRQINNLLEKKSEMELLISDLEINNKNLTIENNNLIDELNEYKKDKNIEKNCFQNNLRNK